MGGKQTKEQKLKDREENVYDTRKIFIDSHGIPRYDKNRPIKNTEYEARKIIELDVIDLEVGKRYYAMDTAWLNAWLQHTVINKDVSPDPGPCRNNRLIEWNEEAQSYIVKPQATIASATWKGDYRRVSKETWNAFSSFYPGSGPTITFEFISTSEGGPLKPSRFIIEDPPPPPEVKPKKRTISFEMLQSVFNSPRSLSAASIASDKDSKPLLSPSAINSSNDEASSTMMDDTQGQPAIVKPVQDDEKKFQSVFFPDEKQ